MTMHNPFTAIANWFRKIFKAKPVLNIIHWDENGVLTIEATGYENEEDFRIALSQLILALSDENKKRGGPGFKLIAPIEELDGEPDNTNK